MKYLYKIVLPLFAILLIIVIYSSFSDPTPVDNKTTIGASEPATDGSVSGRDLSANESDEEKASTQQEHLKTMGPDDDSEEAQAAHKRVVESNDNQEEEVIELDNSIIYNPDNLDKELDLAFICQQKNCQYDDSETGLKGIPLLKNWAIESPYFYTTPQGDKAGIPTILFINTKTGLWFVLNQRQASNEMMSCIEFGKEGRLSAEETLCSPKDTPAGMLGDMVTLIEDVETWRSQ